jgi:hypothetical protein
MEIIRYCGWYRDIKIKIHIKRKILLMDIRKLFVMIVMDLVFFMFQMV